MLEVKKALDEVGQYVITLEGELEREKGRAEAEKARADSEKLRADENEAKGRRVLDRLTVELRQQYQKTLTTLYKALQVPPDFGGLLVYVGDAPELTHRAMLKDGALELTWGKAAGLGNVIRVTRSGLDGLLKWEMRGDVEQLEGDLTRLWALQDEKKLKAVLGTSPAP